MTEWYLSIDDLMVIAQW